MTTFYLSTILWFLKFALFNISLQSKSGRNCFCLLRKVSTFDYRIGSFVDRKKFDLQNSLPLDELKYFHPHTKQSSFNDSNSLFLKGLRGFTKGSGRFTLMKLNIIELIRFDIKRLPILSWVTLVSGLGKTYYWERRKQTYRCE